ncbi:glutathione S-transferase [Mycena rosella]|uniref:glutathione transferase n=1 Tax=Mycena rosella TaxID=1033263 RepID=A0AAD7CMD8_MYCRO|nr:glutathione S-transferase [Mycena rosella]
MTILKLYGAAQTTSTRRVGTVLYEARVPFELIEVDLRNGEHKTPAYLEKQPFGLIPYIDDDGFILYQTRAICRYIAAKYPACGLIPTDPKKNALFEQAASVELTSFDPSASMVGFETRAKPRMGLKTDQTVIDKEIATLDKMLAVYDTILAKQKYLAGDELTLADLFHLPYAPLLATTGSDVMTRRPNVSRWYNELVSRPCWLVFTDGVKTTIEY